jgi:hypothetical protein
MSELQIYLLAAGAAFIVLVVVYNIVTERRARKRAERAFGDRPGDALFDKVPQRGSPAERREPVLGNMPASDIVEAAEEVAHKVPPQELEAPGGPMAEITSRIDTVAVILADDPIMEEQLEPLLNALQSHTTGTRVEGIVDEQWHPIETSPRRSWRELRAGLQLASRSGPVTEDEIERFNGSIADFAASVGAVSQREAPATAASRARDLDRFCAEADIEIAVNVIGQFGATFSVAKVKGLALEHGMSETASGDLVAFAPDGSTEFAIRRFEDATHKSSPAVYPGITFALDLPHVSNAAVSFTDMVGVAESFARQLSGQMVDDNRKPLTEAGIASIRRTLDKVVADMEAHGVPAGSSLARRLFT